MKLRDIVLATSLVTGVGLGLGGSAHGMYKWGEAGYSFWDTPRKAGLVYPNGDWNSASIAGTALVWGSYIGFLFRKKEY